MCKKVTSFKIHIFLKIISMYQLQISTLSIYGWQYFVNKLLTGHLNPYWTRFFQKNIDNLDISPLIHALKVKTARKLYNIEGINSIKKFSINILLIWNFKNSYYVYTIKTFNLKMFNLGRFNLKLKSFVKTGPK